MAKFLSEDDNNEKISEDLTKLDIGPLKLQRALSAPVQTQCPSFERESLNI